MDNNHFSCRIIRSDRRTIALQITPEGQLLVRCPRRMPETAVRAFVQSKAAWIEKHLQKQSRPRPQPLTPAQLQALKTPAREIISQRAAYFAPLVGVTYGSVSIRQQRTRWGSCSGKGNLNFNCRLMLAPPEVLDYVVVHELCHRKHLNHSAAFWAEVERVFPDYREKRQWLKENGGQLIGKLS